jgi:MoxR-like ATPase
MEQPHPPALTEALIQPFAEKLGRLRSVLNTVLFGQEQLVELVLTGLLARGHLLLEGLPGLGKTELVKGLAKAVKLEVRRVQFTPDLLPGDITGNPMLQESGGVRSFVFQRGPVFANLLLADEINRASPKTQAALLEAMQERRVTVLGESHVLPEPFFVLATQNPIELEGTYPLPEAQLDRFLFKLEVLKVSAAVLERVVREREMGVEPEVPCVLSAEELRDVLQLVRRVHLPQAVANYIARLVDASQPGNSTASAGVKYGAGPRAALALASAARAKAILSGRAHASFEDVKQIAQPVMAHRMVLDYRARLQGQSAASIVQQLLQEVPVLQKELPGLVEVRGAP